MNKFLKKVTIATAVLFIIAGCSSAPKREPAPSPFVAVRTIELRDLTDPVLLASTSAKRVSEYVEIGLAGRGYTISRGGPSDAVATVTVQQYRTVRDSKRDWVGWGNLNYVEVGISEWTLTVTRNGETIFQKRIKHSQAMPIDQLAGRQVQDVLQQIPVRPKE